MIEALLLALAAPAPALSPLIPLHRWTQAGPVKVRADRLIEDSRCPMNARCVWAGRVIVAATVRDRGRTRTVRLTLGEPADVLGRRLTLAAVSPERVAGQARAPRYRVAFELRN